MVLIIFEYINVIEFAKQYLWVGQIELRLYRYLKIIYRLRNLVSYTLFS